MIAELWGLGALFVAACLGLCLLAENGTLEDYSEKRHVNKLADRSRNRKPAKRRNSRWAGIGAKGSYL